MGYLFDTILSRVPDSTTRNVLRLAHEHEMSDSEIAADLGITKTEVARHREQGLAVLSRVVGTV